MRIKMGYNKYTVQYHRFTCQLLDLNQLSMSPGRLMHCAETGVVVKHQGQELRGFFFFFISLKDETAKATWESYLDPCEQRPSKQLLDLNILLSSTCKVTD